MTVVRFPYLRPYEAIIDSTISSSSEVDELEDEARGGGGGGAGEGEGGDEEAQTNHAVSSPSSASSTTSFIIGAVAKTLRRRSSVPHKAIKDVELATIKELMESTEVVGKGDGKNNDSYFREYEKRTVQVPTTEDDDVNGAETSRSSKGDIYNMTSSSPDCNTEKEEEDGESMQPFSKDYVGISASYFSVGLMIGGSLSLLYPVLIVKGGATSSLMAASQAVIMVFWSYKIFFGFLSDW